MTFSLLSKTGACVFAKRGKIRERTKLMLQENEPLLTYCLDGAGRVGRVDENPVGFIGQSHGSFGPTWMCQMEKGAGG